MVNFCYRFFWQFIIGYWSYLHKHTSVSNIAFTCREIVMSLLSLQNFPRDKMCLQRTNPNENSSFNFNGLKHPTVLLYPKLSSASGVVMLDRTVDDYWIPFYVTFLNKPHPMNKPYSVAKIGICTLLFSIHPTPF